MVDYQVKVQWTGPAEADLKNIFQYISKDSEYFADQIIDSLIDASLRLEQHPKMGRVIPETEDDHLREVIVLNYRLMYEIIDPYRIDVIAVIHGATDFKGFDK